MFRSAMEENCLSWQHKSGQKDFFSFGDLDADTVEFADGFAPVNDIPELGM